MSKQVYFEGGGEPVSIDDFGTFNRGEWNDITKEQEDSFLQRYGFPIEKAGAFYVRTKETEKKKPATTKKGGSK